MITAINRKVIVVFISKKKRFARVFSKSWKKQTSRCPLLDRSLDAPMAEVLPRHQYGKLKWKTIRVMNEVEWNNWPLDSDMHMLMTCCDTSIDGDPNSTGMPMHLLPLSRYIHQHRTWWLLASENSRKTCKSAKNKIPVYIPSLHTSRSSCTAFFNKERMVLVQPWKCITVLVAYISKRHFVNSNR